MTSVSLNTAKVYPDALLAPLPIMCPGCNQPVRGFTGAEQARDTRTVGGAAGAANANLPSNLLRGRLAYILYPCYCRVDAYWMSAMAEEMERRRRGLPAREVSAVSHVDREQRVAGLMSRITALYSERDAAVQSGQQSRQNAVERDLLTLISELCVISPGAQRALPAMLLTSTNEEWARRNNMARPTGEGIRVESINAMPSGIDKDPQKKRVEEHMSQFTQRRRRRITKLHCDEDEHGDA